MLRRTATDPVSFDVGDGEELAVAVVLVVQRTWPFTSANTRFEVLVRKSEGAEEMAGVSRLPTHTTVSRGMLFYHMPR